MSDEAICLLCGSRPEVFRAEGKCDQCIGDAHREKAVGASEGPFYVYQENAWTWIVRDYASDARIAKFTQRYHGPTCVISAAQAEANAHRFASGR